MENNNKPNEAVQNGEELNTEKLQSAALSDEELDDVNGGGALLNAAAVAGIMMMSAATPTVTAAAEQPAIVETYSPEESDVESNLDMVTVEITAPDRAGGSSEGTSRFALEENASIRSPYRRSNFLVEIDGHEVGGFFETSGYDVTSTPIEYRDVQPGKQPGSLKYSNVTLRGGVISSTVFYDWIKDIERGIVRRKTITITALDNEGTEVASWQIINAWPTKYTTPDYNATSSEVAIETLELACEGVIRTK